MRLWSIHPKYLDRKGLLALWRESLLAQKVLCGLTRGYRNHPQLERFKKSGFPLAGIHAYLLGVYRQAKARGYSFDKKRIKPCAAARVKKIPVTRGQLIFEFKHLLAKLKKRDLSGYRKLSKYKRVSVHPAFRIVAGRLERWERPGKNF